MIIVLCVALGASHTYATPGDHLFTIEDPEGPVLFASHQFGYSVSGVGNTIIVGAPPSFGLLPGEVYLYDDVTGELLREIPDPDPQTAGNAAFGYSVAGLNGNVIIGSPGVGLGSSAGPTYLINSETGETILAIPAQSRSFGSVVAPAGNHILIGAPNEDKAYLFSGSTGSRLLTFANPSPSNYDNFGMAIAGNQNLIVVGAEGAAFLYNREGTLLHTLTNPKPGTSEDFGSAVAVLRDQIIVGAPGEPDESYIYFFDTTGEILLEIPNPDTDNGSFGHDICRLGQNLMVNSPGYGDDRIYLLDSITGQVLLEGTNLCGYCAFGATDSSLLNGHSSLALTALQVVHAWQGIGHLVCDCNGDDICNMDDLNVIYEHFGQEVDLSDPLIDVTMNGIVNEYDISRWLLTAGLLNTDMSYLPGDTDLDGDIDQADLNTILTNWGTISEDSILSFGVGNFDGDNDIDGADFLSWQANFSPSKESLLAVPESDTHLLLIIALAGILSLIRRT